MRIAMVVAAAAALAAQAFAGSFAWPDGHKAAVVLTYDDALQSQLDIAIPALDAAGLRGTFFLTGKGISPPDVARWRAAAANGHELGNHTVVHPCLKERFAMPAQYQSESYTIDTMLAEIRTMNAMLTAIDGRLEHAFALPCGDTLAGNQDYLEPLRISGLARYDRDLRWAPKLGIDAQRFAIVWFPEAATGADMIAAVEKAAQGGRLVVIGFHGVGGDYLKATAEAHAQLLAYLKAHQSTLWVTTLTPAMDYLTSHR
jgi:peptidoglycan/xylan/chitin deacetylase (PgdA/CDA1 family)